MKGGKKKSGGGVSGSSNFEPTNQSESDNAAAYGDFEEMPVSDAAAAMEEYNQQQQRKRRLEKGKELQLENDEDFEEGGGGGGYDYYDDGEEDGERSMYDRFNHLEISQESDGPADGDGDGGNEEDEGADERPKLAEGFYEIEAVRKKRTRKGVAQYLIKWRGWPETANTWEPLVNLQSCSDVIEAFEESLQSSKGKAGRKRKRKHGITPQPQSKKKPQQHQSQQRKQQRSGDYNIPAVRVTLMENRSPPAPAPAPTPMMDSLNAVETDVGAVNVNSGETANQGDENRTVAISPQDEERREMGKGSRFGNLDNPDNEGGAHTNGVVPSVDGNEAGQSGRRVGARKRKSGAVKRLKLESSSSHPVDNAQDATIRTTGYSNGIQNGGFGSNKFDALNPGITEIIKAIDYSTSTSDNTQEVAVTFMAKRADGKEVTVTNKFLKAHFPLLLINFYEQHLRYSPTE